MFKLPSDYDVIVVGSGHAGIEAGLAAARIGCRTLMLTQNLDTIGQMSCNPAIGGLAKGHIVREIDALGGIMGVNADATGIQFRMLNRARGPSVRAPRVQCDKKAYQFRMKAVLEGTENLDIKQSTVSGIIVDNGKVVGVETDLGLRVAARMVVITSGTFLRGLLHVGESSKPGGRMADTSSGLSENLRQLGFEVGRFKTGTPCRLNARSIDFSRCAIQLGDEPPPTFAFDPEAVGDAQGGEIFTLNCVRDGKFHVEQLPCWMTQTVQTTHEIVRANLHRSPLYTGRIKGTGPRYCPSIEDKVMKFLDKTSHQLFLEPEGRHTQEFYVNGIFTSRAEDRLFLRHDNADQRLTERAFNLGLVTKARYDRFQEKMRLLKEVRVVVAETKLRGVPIAQLLKRPDFGVPQLPREFLCSVPTTIWELVETDLKYEGYAARQLVQNRQLERRKEQVIPDGVDYSQISGLRSETRQKLATLRPPSIGQAARISGITPADIAIISIWLSKNYLQDRKTPLREG